MCEEAENVVEEFIQGTHAHDSDGKIDYDLGVNQPERTDEVVHNTLLGHKRGPAEATCLNVRI